MVAPFIQPHDLESLLQRKANLVRYQLTDPAAGELDDSGYKTWVQSHINHIHNVVAPLLQQYQARMVFDLHTPPGGIGTGGKVPVFRMFTDRPWAKQTLKDVCTLVARTYKGVPFVRAIEPMNEPHGSAANIIALYKDVIAGIRSVDREKTVIVSTQYGHPDKVEDLILYPFRHLWYTVHMYTPLWLTHQGVYPEFPIGKVYPSARYDYLRMVRTLQDLRDFQKKTGVTVFIGEFSCSNFADENSRYQYLRDCIRIFERYGFHWTYHAWFGESPVWVPQGKVFTLLENRWSKNS